MSNGKVWIGLAIATDCVNVSFFSVRLGLICWVVSFEIFPLRLRAMASALGVVGSRVSNCVVTMFILKIEFEFGK